MAFGHSEKRLIAGFYVLVLFNEARTTAGWSVYKALGLDHFSHCQPTCNFENEVDCSSRQFSFFHNRIAEKKSINGKVLESYFLSENCDSVATGAAEIQRQVHNHRDFHREKKRT